MYVEQQSIVPYNLAGNRWWIERLILSLGDAFNIQVIMNMDTALITGGFALAGGLLGGLVGGRMGAAVGAGISGVTGLGVSTAIALRDLWASIKEKIEEVFYIVLNFLRRLDPIDYVNAVEILMSSYSNKKELVMSIIGFVAHKLGRQVISRLTDSSS